MSIVLPSLDRVLDAIVRIDKANKVTYVSDNGLRWFGVVDVGKLPANFLDIVHPDDVATFTTAKDLSPEPFSCDIRVRNPTSTAWVHLRGYQLPGEQQIMLCLFEISFWKAQDAAWRHAAEHDELTGLPNRSSLKPIVDREIAGGKPFCMALLDLDGFKRVNDTYGHLMGDAVLVESTRRFLKVIADSGIVARLGGDEFVIVLPNTTAAEAANRLYDILLVIARPFETAPHNAYLGVSIGIAEYPTHGDNYSALMKNSDDAMYLSKREGKNRISIFAQTTVSADFSIQAAIHQGVEEGEFYLEFQPQFDVNRRLIGAEALMRWTSPTLGRISPDQFIPIVEESGLMPFLGQWALRYACHQLRRFQARIPTFVVSVNVSPVQFGRDGFDTFVLEAIAETGVTPANLILEITESTMMQTQEATEQALAVLRGKGIRFSIDDFGTGFSSLAYLTRLPVSSIKIDKAFVRAIEDPEKGNHNDRKLISAMINVGHSIDLKVVAEGVENEQQLAFLKEAGCNLIQGYLLGKPMSADRLMELIELHAEAAQ